MLIHVINDGYAKFTNIILVYRCFQLVIVKVITNIIVTMDFGWTSGSKAVECTLLDNIYINAPITSAKR